MWAWLLGQCGGETEAELSWGHHWHSRMPSQGGVLGSSEGWTCRGVRHLSKEVKPWDQVCGLRGWSCFSAARVTPHCWVCASKALRVDSTLSDTFWQSALPVFHNQCSCGQQEHQLASIKALRGWTLCGRFEENEGFMLQSTNTWTSGLGPGIFPLLSAPLPGCVILRMARVSSAQPQC